MGRLLRQTDFHDQAAWAEKSTTYAGEHILSPFCTEPPLPRQKQDSRA